MREIKRSQVILIVVILIVSVFSIALVVSGRQNSHPGPVVWEESEIDGYPIGGFFDYDQDDNILYSRSRRDQLIAVDLEDEEILWKHEHYFIEEEQSERITAISEYNDIVYIGDRIGNVAAIDAEEGEEIWQDRIFGKVYSLYVSESRLFVGGFGIAEAGDAEGLGVRAVDIETGEEMMNHSHGGGATSVFVENGVVYSAEGNKIIAADAETGEKVWEHTHHDFAFSLTVEDNIVYSGGKYEVIAFDAEKEEKIWEHTFHSERETTESVVNAIQVDDDMVYSGCEYNEIVAAEKEDGEEIWTFDHHSSVRTMQTCEDELYIGGRAITIREQEGGLLLGMYRSLDSGIQSMTGWISGNLRWIFLGLIIIVSIVGFLAPRKRIRHDPDQNR